MYVYKKCILKIFLASKLNPTPDYIFTMLLTEC